MKLELFWGTKMEIIIKYFFFGCHFVAFNNTY